MRISDWSSDVCSSDLYKEAVFYRWGDVSPAPGTTETVPLTATAIDELLAGTGNAESEIANSSYRAYFSNVLNITPQLMALVSLRADYFDSKGEKGADDDDFRSEEHTSELQSLMRSSYAV